MHFLKCWTHTKASPSGSKCLFKKKKSIAFSEPTCSVQEILALNYKEHCWFISRPCGIICHCQDGWLILMEAPWARGVGGGRGWPEMRTQNSKYSKTSLFECFNSSLFGNLHFYMYKKSKQPRVLIFVCWHETYPAWVSSMCIYPFSVYLLKVALLICYWSLVMSFYNHF